MSHPPTTPSRDDANPSLNPVSKPPNRGAKRILVGLAIFLALSALVAVDWNWETTVTVTSASTSLPLSSVSSAGGGASLPPSPSSSPLGRNNNAAITSLLAPPLRQAAPTKTRRKKRTQRADPSGGGTAVNVPIISILLLDDHTAIGAGSGAGGLHDGTAKLQTGFERNPTTEGAGAGVVLDAHSVTDVTAEVTAVANAVHGLLQRAGVIATAATALESSASTSTTGERLYYATGTNLPNRLTSIEWISPSGGRGDVEAGGDTTAGTSASASTSTTIQLLGASGIGAALNAAFEELWGPGSADVYHHDTGSKHDASHSVGESRGSEDYDSVAFVVAVDAADAAWKIDPAAVRRLYDVAVAIAASDIARGGGVRGMTSGNTRRCPHALQMSTEADWRVIAMPRCMWHAVGAFDSNARSFAAAAATPCVECADWAWRAQCLAEALPEVPPSNGREKDGGRDDGARLSPSSNHHEVRRQPALPARVLHHTILLQQYTTCEHERCFEYRPTRGWYHHAADYAAAKWGAMFEYELQLPRPPPVVGVDGAGAVCRSPFSGSRWRADIIAAATQHTAAANLPIEMLRTVVLDAARAACLDRVLPLGGARAAASSHTAKAELWCPFNATGLLQGSPPKLEFGDDEPRGQYHALWQKLLLGYHRRRLSERALILRRPIEAVTSATSLLTVTGESTVGDPAAAQPAGTSGTGTPSSGAAAVDTCDQITHDYDGKSPSEFTAACNGRFETRTNGPASAGLPSWLVNIRARLNEGRIESLHSDVLRRDYVIPALVTLVTRECGLWTKMLSTVDLPVRRLVVVWNSDTRCLRDAFKLLLLGTPPGAVTVLHVPQGGSFAVSVNKLVLAALAAPIADELMAAAKVADGAPPSGELEPIPPWLLITNADIEFRHGTEQLALAASRRAGRARSRVAFLNGPKRDFAVVAVTARTFQRAGLMDENFNPAYHEDIDYTWRAHLVGLSEMYVAKWKYEHLSGGMSKAASSQLRPPNRGGGPHRGQAMSKDDDATATAANIADYMSRRERGSSMNMCTAKWGTCTNARHRSYVPLSEWVRPYNSSGIPVAYWHVDPVRRKCIATGHGPKYKKSFTLCYYNGTTMRREFPDARLPVHVHSRRPLIPALGLLLRDGHEAQFDLSKILV
jgi:hypothetical protein